MDSLPTTPMLMCNSNIRDRQLSWLPPGSTMRQDQDLIDFIRRSGFTKCCAVGDVEHFRSCIDFVDQEPVDFCMYIQNTVFDFDELARDLNLVIATRVTPGGRIYLALNRYLIKPRRYATDLPEDFDDAIAQYAARKILARIDQYLPCGSDGGNRFNWVHPLTRFYMSKCP